MPGDIKLGIRLTADSKGFVGGVRISQKALSGLKRESRAATAATERLGATTRRTLAHIGHYAAGIFAVHQIMRGGRAVIAYADSYTELNNRLRLVTKSEEGLVASRKSLLEISQRTRTDLSANAQLYSRISLASQELGRSQSEVLQVTELLNKQVLIGGNNSAEAAAGLVQFAQGLASGRLQGDELRSVMENLLGVQQGLIIGFAKLRSRGQIDFDVTRANIRKLASEGVLSSDLLLDAVLASAEDTDAKFQQVNKTVAGATQQLGNSIAVIVGEINESLNASSTFAETLGDISQAIDHRSIAELERSLGHLATAMELIGAVLLVRLSSSALVAEGRIRTLGTATLTTSARFASMTGRSRAAAASLVVLSRAGSVARGVLAFLGGPVGVIALAAVAMFEFSQRTKQAREELSEMPDDIDTVISRIKLLSDTQRKKRKQDLQDKINERAIEIQRKQSILSRPNTSLSRRQFSSSRNREKKESLRDEIAELREIQAAEQQELKLLDQSALRAYTAQQDASRKAKDGISKEVIKQEDERSADYLAVKKELLLNEEKITAEFRDRLVRLRGDRNPRELADDVDYRKQVLRARNQYDKAISDIKNKRDKPANKQTNSKQDDHRQSVAAIKSSLLSLKSPYEQAIGRIEEFKRKALSGLDTGAADYAAEVQKLEQSIQSQLEKALEDKNSKQQESIAAINDAVLSLKSPLEQATAAAAKWRNETLTDVAEVTDGYQDAASKIEYVYHERISRAQEEAAERAKEQAEKLLQESTRFEDGVQRALQKYAERAKDVASSIESAITSGLESMSQGLADFVTTGEFQFKRFAQSAINEIAKITLQKNITGPLANVLNSVVGGFFGGGGIAGNNAFGFNAANQLAGAQYHVGGIVGVGGTPRQIPAVLLAGARRMHSGGIAGNEVPAILQRGEEVLPANHPRHRDNAGGDNVTITQNFDFRNADETSIARLQSAAGRIKAETKAEVLDYLKNTRRGLSITGRA